MASLSSRKAQRQVALEATGAYTTARETAGAAGDGATTLDDLTDVDITTAAPTDGQSLIWNNANSKFIPGDSFSQAEFNTALGTISASIIPDTDITYDIGSSTNRFRDLYLSGTTINLGGATLSTDANSGAIALTAKPTEVAPNPSSLVVTNTGATLAVATVGGVIDFEEAADKIATAVSSGGFVKTYYWEGVLQENVSRRGIYVHRDATLTQIRVNVKTAGNSAAAIQVKQNGTVLNTITIPMNVTSVYVDTAHAISGGDYMTVDITASSSANDLYVTLSYA